MGLWTEVRFSLSPSLALLTPINNNNNISPETSDAEISLVKQTLLNYSRLQTELPTAVAGRR